MTNINYNDLQVKYDNFLAPSMDITINNNNFSEKRILVDNISINLDIENASTASFSILNSYDLEKRSFNKNIKNLFKLGEKIEIKLGYGSSLTKVFSGFIKSINYEFSEIPQILINAVDVKNIMASNNEDIKIYEMQKYSDLFSTIVEKYSNICSIGEVKNTNEVINTIEQKGSDLKFLKNIARKSDRSFKVINGVVSFEEPDKGNNSQIIIELEFGSNLMSFKKSIEYLHKQIEVRGKLKSTKTKLTSIGSISSKNTKKILNTPSIEVINVSEIESQEQLDEICENKIRELGESTNIATGSCIGLPEIAPGVCIKINNFDEDFNKTYNVLKVQHDFSSQNGFNTSFTVEDYFT